MASRVGVEGWEWRSAMAEMLKKEKSATAWATKASLLSRRLFTLQFLLEEFHVRGPSDSLRDSQLYRS